MINVKKIVLTAALGALAVPAAFAGNVYAPAGERVMLTHAAPASDKTRAQTLEELSAFRKIPVTADGWRYVGGEAGWAYDGHGYELRAGQVVHADRVAHTSARPKTPITEQDRALFRLNYPGA